MASDLGSRRELVEHGKTGLLYAVKNVAELANAIALLRDRPELAKQMGDAGRELVRERHSQDEHFAALEKIYEELICEKRPRVARSRRIHPRGSNRSTGPEPLKIAFIGGRGSSANTVELKPITRRPARY